MATVVAEFGHCRQNGDSRRFRRQIVAEIGDYSLQCGQAIRWIIQDCTPYGMGQMFGQGENSVMSMM